MKQFAAEIIGFLQILPYLSDDESGSACISCTERFKIQMSKVTSLILKPLS